MWRHEDRSCQHRAVREEPFDAHGRAEFWVEINVFVVPLVWVVGAGQFPEDGPGRVHDDLRLHTEAFFGLEGRVGIQSEAGHAGEGHPGLKGGAGEELVHLVCVVARYFHPETLIGEEVVRDGNSSVQHDKSSLENTELNKYSMIKLCCFLGVL